VVGGGIYAELAFSGDILSNMAPDFLHYVCGGGKRPGH